jgi:hypothetical protein
MFASLGAYGHLYPMMPLALVCADAGHEAVIASGPPFLGRLPLAYPTPGLSRARHGVVRRRREMWFPRSSSWRPDSCGTGSFARTSEMARLGRG